MLPRQRVSVTILLPVGAETGDYEVQLLDEELRARANSRGTAAIRDFVTKLNAAFDLRRLPPGEYKLALRLAGQDWRFFPARLLA